jgi:hypothetical protein
MNQPLAIPPGVRVTISAEDTQAAELSASRYAFVMNVSSLVGADSFTLALGHELRRASTTEISAIKEVIIKSQMHGPTMMPWEQRTMEGGSVESMPEAEWRYFVISFQDSNNVLLEIEEAFSVARVELKIGFTILRSFGGVGLMFDPGRFFSFWNALNGGMSISSKLQRPMLSKSRKSTRNFNNMTIVWSM